MASTTKELPRKDRIDVLGSLISDCDSEMAFEKIASCMEAGDGGYICFTNAHTAVEGCRNRDFQNVTNQSLLSLADGSPVFWVARLRGGERVAHLPGPDFMLQALQRYPERRHFFLGSRPEVLSALTQTLTSKIPSLNVVGSFSPPFRPLTDQENEDMLAHIVSTRAEFVWIGLGAPKQELWMGRVSQMLKPAILLGVGAAFDFHAGEIKRAPKWIRRLGLEWLFRLAQEPRRLWRRYLITNSLFVYFFLRDQYRAWFR